MDCFGERWIEWATTPYFEQTSLIDGSIKFSSICRNLSWDYGNTEMVYCTHNSRMSPNNALLLRKIWTPILKRCSYLPTGHTTELECELNIKPTGCSRSKPFKKENKQICRCGSKKMSFSIYRSFSDIKAYKGNSPIIADRCDTNVLLKKVRKEFIG